jgi:hypothetical protein
LTYLRRDGARAGERRQEKDRRKSSCTVQYSCNVQYSSTVSVHVSLPFFGPRVTPVRRMIEGEGAMRSDSPSMYLLVHTARRYCIVHTLRGRGRTARGRGRADRRGKRKKAKANEKAKAARPLSQTRSNRTLDTPNSNPSAPADRQAKRNATIPRGKEGRSVFPTRTDTTHGTARAHGVAAAV